MILRRLSSKPRGLLRDVTLVVAIALMRADAQIMTIGGGVFLIGLALHFWSKGCLVRTCIVTTWGPYSLVRHPFYLANFLIDEGICLISGNLWLAALYFVAFLVVYLPIIRQEEQHLTSLHGVAYTSYALTVPALLPYRLHAISAPKRFSWANIRREREMSRLLRILAIPWYFIIASTLLHETPYGHTGRAELLWTATGIALVLNASSVALGSTRRRCARVRFIGGSNAFSLPGRDVKRSV